MAQDDTTGDESAVTTTTGLAGFKETLRSLYFGLDGRSRAFRFGLMLFDIASIAFFIVSSLEHNAWTYAVDLMIALIIIADFSARWWLSWSTRKYFAQATTWADLVVIATLLLPMLFQSFLFLRVVRALRLLRSYHVLRDLRRDYPFFKRNEEIIQSVLNLLVFIFVMTALVYVLQARVNPAITNYVDALYFTVAALTTTGFGDITLIGSTGRLLSVLIMIMGFALFLRLVQTIFRPTKVAYECPDCGLRRHDPDAVHCKHCGRTIHIETDGANEV
ncbi:MAG: ion channel [Pseudomonadota bacterium]